MTADDAYEGEHRIVRLMDLQAISADPSQDPTPITSLIGFDTVLISVIDPDEGEIISTTAASNNNDDDWYAIVEMPSVGTKKKAFTLQAMASISGNIKFWETPITVHPIVSPL